MEETSVSRDDEEEEEEEDMDQVLMSEISHLIDKANMEKLNSGNASRIVVEIGEDEEKRGEEEANPSALEDESASKPIETVGEKCAVYFRMLKMGVPLEAVKQRMVQQGVDPKMLEMDPAREVPKLVTVGEKCAVYFRMLKMGIDALAVKHKMTQDKVNPDLLDVDPSSPYSEGEVVGVKAINNNNKTTTTATVSSMRPKKLHWTTIPSHRISNKETVWTSSSSLLCYNPSNNMAEGPDGETEEEASERGGGGGIDLLNISADLEKMFLGTGEVSSTATAISGNDSKNGSNKSNSVVKATSVLDPRRAQNVSIGIAKLRMPVDTFIQALVEMDFDVMTVGVVEIVKGCSLCPISLKQDEREVLLAIPDGHPTATCDAFLREVAKRVPDAANR